MLTRHSVGCDSSNDALCNDGEFEMRECFVERNIADLSAGSLLVPLCEVKPSRKARVPRSPRTIVARH